MLLSVSESAIPPPPAPRASYLCPVLFQKVSNSCRMIFLARFRPLTAIESYPCVKTPGGSSPPLLPRFSDVQTISNVQTFPRSILLVFTLLRTLLRNGALPTLFFSIASALFPMQRGVYVPLLGPWPSFPGAVAYFRTLHPAQPLARIPCFLHRPRFTGHWSQTTPP